jgi:FAD/FMN-containing dehydrogenase
MTLNGWGRFPRIQATPVRMRDAADAARAFATHPSLIARGNGRSYGDAALNYDCTLSTLDCDHLLAFDPATGEIACEAGLKLSDLLAFAVPRGFFPPVTPGTRFVTIGGMVAADVHGKNHHSAGSFCRHVIDLTLLLPDGSRLRCSRTENTAIFDATCGGMGLTGVILDVRFRLLPIETARMRQETLRAADLDAMLALCAASSAWTYSVAWIDCLARGGSLGRGLIYRGEHATRGECADAALAPPEHRARRMPIDLPGWSLNRLSVSAFNALYYRRGKPGTSFPDYETFFYPLDALLDWNRIYGGAGFTQYQCVLPLAASPAGMRTILHTIAAAGRGSFLAVLKLFGPGDPGYLSFPMEGYTLALDFPADTGTFNLLLRLDAILAEYGGRLYLAKDARGSAQLLRQGYPQLPAFQSVRAAIDPQRRLQSLLSARLDL